MKRAAKIIGGILLGLVLLVLAVGTGAYVFLTSDYLRAQIEKRADAASGRKTTIGRMTVAWAWTPTVRLENVALSNADWGKAPHMFEARLVEFQIRIWPLLHGELAIPRLVLDNPRIDLERNDQDQLNWSPEESPLEGGTLQQVKPETRSEVPLIGQLEIRGGRISYSDRKRALTVTGSALTATGQEGGQPQTRLALKGTLEGQPLAIDFIGGSVLMLRDTDAPYPLDFRADYGETHLAVKGVVQDPFEFEGANVQLSLSGPDLSDIFPLLGIPGPPTPPYRITGKLERQPGSWHLDDMTWHAGNSDLAGSLTLDQRTKPSKLTATLTSQNLAFADLAPLVGAPPGRTANVSETQRQTEQTLEARAELFPDTPMQVERLRAMSMDVTLDARRVVAPDYLPVSAIRAHFDVHDGRAVVEPLTMTVAGGTVSGRMAVDAHGDTPVASADLGYRDLDLNAFFRGSKYVTTTQGRLQGRVRLEGTGRSLARVMSSADGEFVMGSAGGSISSLMVSLAGLQIADALVLYITGDDRIPITCAAGRLAVDHGTATFDRAVLDTTKSVVHFDGTVSLSTQVVNAEVTADVKQFSALDLHGPVVVQGKIRSPRISLGRVIPIPTPDFGGAKDVPCAERLQQLATPPP